MSQPQPRLTSVMGVAGALLASLESDEVVDVLIGEFSWDVAFQALSLLRGDEADRAFARCWERLVLGRIASEVEPITHTWLTDGV